MYCLRYRSFTIIIIIKVAHYIYIYIVGINSLLRLNLLKL